MLVCWTVRGVIASASHYKWHRHLTKHMKGLRSNGSSSNVLIHTTLPPAWWCLDQFSNHINLAFGDKYGLIELNLTAEERYPACPLVLLVPQASRCVCHCLLPATISQICPHQLLWKHYVYHICVTYAYFTWRNDPCWCVQQEYGCRWGSSQLLNPSYPFQWSQNWFTEVDLRSLCTLFGGRTINHHQIVPTWAVFDIMDPLMLANADETRGVGEPLHSCLTPSIPFIDPKVDCEELSHCLGQHLFVSNTLTTTILSLNCPKL